ncbi:SDR family oxidoreductase [Conexibacter sp. DBS9H8]|uniref:SDR family oxidoreductase n=1 Tax=Conexibacter sp. DBS9H8 TaxID=2937801 RepID=UPI00200C10C3|nr:SDR family oxidoreductase [Conexibacter sp. DBS9H8]
MTPAALPLHGRVVAITGAGRGIGAATARALAGCGMKVAIGELDLAAAETTAAEIGHGAIALPLDVTSRESFAAFLDAAEAQLGPVDVLVNNAGIMPLSRVVSESDRTADLLLDVNVRGVMHGSKEALARMGARRRGHIVNIASTAGKGGFVGGATYCGTKAFVVVFSEALLLEAREVGVHVSCVMPGVVNTELSAGLGEARGVKNAQPEDVAAAIVEALQRPHFDVYVPKSIGPIQTVMTLLPRSWREKFTHALKADSILDEIDASKRRAYEERVATRSKSAEDAPVAATPAADGDADVATAAPRETVTH